MPSRPRVPRVPRLLAAFGAIVLAVTSVGVVAAAEPPEVDLPTRDAGRAWTEPVESTEARYIVEFRKGASRAERAEVARDGGLRLVKAIPGTNVAVYTAAGRKPDLRRIRRQAGVVAASRSLQSGHFVEPTDPGWTLGYMWGLENTGQTILEPGVPNVDVDAKQAWSRTTGRSDLVVAVIDDGVDFSHPDLASRAWVNPGESGGGKETNGVDDDGNGYIDDVNGWDFCNNDKSVHDFDGDEHGTHVAGTIAASMDGQGVVGVAPNVKIMALKFLRIEKPGVPPKCGWDDMAIEAIAYAKSFGVRISNNSWGRRGGTTAQNAPLYNAIRDSGMLFVAAAGNSGINNDSNTAPAYPASFDLANILSVGAVDNRGRKPSWSNYGKTRVDVFAPGVDILSSLPADSDHQVGWGWGEGTSMAAPHVTGVASLVASVKPSLISASGVATIKSKIMATGKKLSAVSGKSVTDAIPSALRAVDFVAPSAVGPTSHAFVPGSRLGSTASIRVAWPAATDDFSGVAAYAVRQSVNGGPWGSLATSNTTRTIDRSVGFTSTYRYSVRTRDRGNNYAAWVDGPQITPKRYQEGTSLATYGGSWTRASISSASGGRTRYAKKAGAWVQFSFTGRAVAVVSPKGPSRGTVKVYVDGVYVKTISTYRSSSLSRVLVFTKSWASSAKHKVKLVVVGTAGHPRFDIDAFLVLR